MKIRPYFTGAIAFLFLLLAALNPLAQAAPPAPTGPLVKKIDVQYAGPVTISKERIIANMRTQVGKPYAEQAVEEDIRNLYATGNVTNVRIFGEPVTDGVKVVVVIQTKAKVSEVVIEGVSQLKVNSLRKKLAVKSGGLLNEADLEQDRQKILEAYEKQNYTDTKVTYKVDSNDALGTAKVTFTVAESGKVVIHDIRFEGNSTFKGKQLKKLMKTKPANLLSFITKAGQLKNEQMDEDLVALREFYQNNGYMDVQVRNPQAEDLGKGRVDLIIPIVEGSQYRVGKVEVVGANVFTPDEVRRQVKTSEGGVFSPKRVREDNKAISDLYGTRGYIDLQINADTTSGGRDVINVAYRLDEGSQSYVEHINVQGNTRTKDKVIRRELALAPGEIYNSVRIDASKQRLQNLNYFSKVDTYPSDTSIPGHKDLNVLVEEKRTGSFNFGVGFSSIDNLVGFAEIQQSNFDITNWPHFTGGGQRFRARVQYGTERKDFIISLTEPWFLDYQVAVGGELFYNESSYYSTVYNQSNYGFDINARKVLGTFKSGVLDGRIDYRLERIRIFDVSNDASEDIKSQAGNYNRSAIAGLLNYDSRDSFFLSRKGQKLDLGGFLAGGFLGGNVDVYGLDLSGSQFFSLPWDTIFIINGQVAVVGSWSSGSQVPVFDRLYLGGANNLRGFSYREVGPKDDQGEPIGGNSLARITFEYTFPIVERVRGALFYDAGFVNGGSWTYSTSNYNSDFGFGVRLDLPIGPVRLDYGIPIKSDEWNNSSGKFNFNVGYQF